MKHLILFTVIVLAAANNTMAAHRIIKLSKEDALSLLKKANPPSKGMTTELSDYYYRIKNPVKNTNILTYQKQISIDNEQKTEHACLHIGQQGINELLQRQGGTAQMFLLRMPVQIAHPQTYERNYYLEGESKDPNNKFMHQIIVAEFMQFEKKPPYERKMSQEELWVQNYFLNTYPSLQAADHVQFGDKSYGCEWTSFCNENNEEDSDTDENKKPLGDYRGEAVYAFEVTQDQIPDKLLKLFESQETAQLILNGGGPDEQSLIQIEGDKLNQNGMNLYKIINIVGKSDLNNAIANNKTYRISDKKFRN